MLIAAEGVVLRHTDRAMPKATSSRAFLHEEIEPENEEQVIKVVEECGTFEDFVVWGHDRSPEATEDPYTKGMKEWINLAEMVCTVQLHSLRPSTDCQ